MTRNFHLLRDDPDTRDIYQPVRVLCAYRRDKNLRDSLVRSHLNSTTASVEDRGTFPCGRSRCNTCAHTNASPTINTPGGHITINTKYTCTSDNVVYLIKCRTCNKVYIGETGRRLGDRFREHLRSTRQTNTDLPVGRHFASLGHASTAMLVSVIRSGFRDTQDRRRFEAGMIFKHKTLHPGGLNTDLPFYKVSKSTRARDIEIMFVLNVYTRALSRERAQITSNSNFRYVTGTIYSCFLSTDEEAAASKRMDIYNFLSNYEFLLVYLSYKTLRNTVFFL